MDPIAKLIKIALALALTGLALYFFGVRRARAEVPVAPAIHSSARQPHAASA